MFVAIMIAYLVLGTCFDQFYKLTTKTMKNAAAQTIGLQIVAGISCLLFLPFFEFRLPSNPWVYFFLLLSCVFYALNNRILANVRRNLGASVIGILRQSYTVLMTLAGFVLYSEPVTVLKVIGLLLIIAGNVLVFWQQGKIKDAKYVWFGVLAYAFNVVAGLIDIECSGEFNFAFYSSLCYLVPAVLIWIIGRVKIKSIVDEFKRANKRDYLITGFCWGVHYACLIIAYRLSEVSLVAPLASLVIFSNVIAAYIWLNEREHLVRKIVASLIAILGVVLISI